MLDIKAFHATRGKVKTMDFHPVRPLLVITDKEDAVEIWNYETGRQVMCFNPSDLDTSALAELQLQKLAEKLPQYYGPRCSTRLVPVSPAYKKDMHITSFTPQPTCQTLLHIHSPQINTHTHGRMSKGAERDLQRAQTTFGFVRQALFLDEDVKFWGSERHRDRRTAQGDKFVLTLPTTEAPLVLKGRRFLAVLCESKLLLLDLDSRKRRDAASRVHFDGTALVALTHFSSLAPDGTAQLHLAIGCSDGTVRLFNLATWHVDVVLNAPKGSAVSCLAVVPGATARLAAGYLDGQLCCWDAAPSLARAPTPTALAPLTGAVSTSAMPTVPPPVELDPIAAFPAHRSTVLSITAAPGPWDPAERAAAPILVTSSKDNTTAVWDPLAPGGKERGAWRELSRVQAVWKAPVIDTCFAPAAQSHTVLGITTMPKVLGLGGGLTADLYGRALASSDKVPKKEYVPAPEVCDLRPYAPAGDKKASKSYCIAAHPLRAGPLVAVGLNTGFVLLSGDRLEMIPAVAPLPKLVNSTTLNGLSLFSMRGGELLFSTHGLNAPAVPAPQPLLHGANPDNTYTLTEKWTPAVQAPLRAPGGCEVTVCPTGRAVGLVWPEQGFHSVLVDGMAGGGVPRYTAKEEGRGLSVAWRTVDRDAPSQYAVLARKPIAAPKETAEAKKKGFFSRSSKAKEADREAPNAAMAFEAPVLQVYQIQPNSGDLVPVGQSVRLSSMGVDAIRLHSGPMVGLSYYKGGVYGMPGGSGSAKAPRMLRFLSWQDLTPLSPEIPDPDLLSWDPMCAFCLMARKTRVEIYAARSAFSLIASIPIVGATSCFWHCRQAYVTTPTGVYVLFVSLPSSAKAKSLFPGKEKKKRKDAFVQVIQLASFEPTRPTSLTTPVLRPADDGSGASTTTTTTTTLQFLDVSGASLPPCQILPPGPLRAVGVREGGLLLADRHGECSVVWLQHPGLRARTQAAAGNLKGAIDIAATEMDTAAHDDIAKFLAAMYGPPGAREALRLPGVTPVVEAELALFCGDLDRAMGAVQCLAGGGDKPRGEMRRISTTGSETGSFRGGPRAFETLAGASQGLLDIFAEGGAEVPGVPGAGAGAGQGSRFDSAVDWDSDLAMQRHDSANPASTAAGGFDKPRGSAGRRFVPAAGSLRKTADLPLARTSLRLAEAAVLAKKTRYVSMATRLALTCRDLPREEQMRAVLCLARVRLVADLRGTAMAYTQRREKKTALLAATLSGDAELVDRTLESFGMSAERVLHARTWRGEALVDAAQQWRERSAAVASLVEAILTDAGVKVTSLGGLGAGPGADLHAVLGI